VFTYILEIIIDLPIGFPTNNIISLYAWLTHIYAVVINDATNRISLPQASHIGFEVSALKNNHTHPTAAPVCTLQQVPFDTSVHVCDYTVRRVLICARVCAVCSFFIHVGGPEWGGSASP